MSVPEITVALRIRGDDLDPEKISTLLNCRPTGATVKGTPLERKNARTEALTGVWTLRPQSEEQALTIDDMILSLLAKVNCEPRVWRTLAESYACGVFVGVFLKSANQGFTIKSGTLKRLADQFLDVELDIYS
jgi:hypothetical protein